MSKDILKQLWESSTGLLKRFGIAPTIDQQRAVFDEEVREFRGALKLLQKARAGKFTDEQFRADAAQEGADVIVTVLNTLYAAGIGYSEIEQAVSKVIKKNDAKTHKTHRVNKDGKIQRWGRE